MSLYFKTRYSPDRNRSRVWKAICEYLQDFVPPDGVVLDIGAGYCDFINQIKAAQKYALDANPNVADFCTPDVQFLWGKAGVPLEIPRHSVDVVLASNLLEHLSEQQCSDLFDRLDDLLKERGKLILIQPNYYYCYRQYWDDFTHVKAFSHVSLTDFLLSRGYRIVRVEKKFMPFSFKSLLPKSYWITKLYLRSIWRPLAKQMLIVAER
ncbi:MAG: class I SAM-dependent methyltransferase [Acidobacteria bacterium]|nr:MAG: class I SAM-dependent methyltransferase [Acidobacteriota bacterium]